MRHIYIKTRIQVSLLPVLEEDQTTSVLAPEEWTGMPAIKERPSFQFGALNNPTMDLMMLQVEQRQMFYWWVRANVQGGLLRWKRPRHTHLLVEVLNR